MFGGKRRLGQGRSSYNPISDRDIDNNNRVYNSENDKLNIKKILKNIGIGIIILLILFAFVSLFIFNKEEDKIPEVCADSKGKLSGNEWTFTFWVKSNKTIGTGENLTIAQICEGTEKDPKVNFGTCINFSMGLKKAGCENCSGICLPVLDDTFIEQNCGYNFVEKNQWYFVAWSQKGGERIIKYSTNDFNGQKYLTGIGYQCNAVLYKTGEHFILNNHNDIFQFKDINVYNRALSEEEIINEYNKGI